MAAAAGRPWAVAVPGLLKAGESMLFLRALWRGKTKVRIEKTKVLTVFSKVRIVFSKVRTVFSVPSFVFPHLFGVFFFCLPKDIPAGGAEGWPRVGNRERLSRARQEKCRERQQTCTEFCRNFPSGDSRFR